MISKDAKMAKLSKEESRIIYTRKEVVNGRTREVVLIFVDNEENSHSLKLIGEKAEKYENLERGQIVIIRNTSINPKPTIMFTHTELPETTIISPTEKPKPNLEDFLQPLPAPKTPSKKDELVQTLPTPKTPRKRRQLDSTTPFTQPFEEGLEPPNKLNKRLFD
ncbi:unnamed protein product [Bursaphelenchus xylophilus]|uniref:(pine wood nematode) hypothetical protein n=1 Tax=Bursaphelenchus xylophilus TaxID=6326 RepID=A0A1I7SCN3_BURXY|nr:unnamed protein product [Bursaphelenchus xylophilus]CAD5235457.1 unnamed protein product [Bursaphelenchus xylophilus]CAG9093811.1 unnamed protein product [Bursaphelenchus xylophilus]CAG9131872.1 unnamed protein product [Bursaphelenchus xylophilus]